MPEPGGVLSLMFYNIDAKRFSNIVYGNFNYVLRDLAYKKKVSLSPQNPLDPRAVLIFLARDETGADVGVDHRDPRPCLARLQRLQLVMRDGTQVRLEREALRLSALLESARALSQTTGVPVRWQEMQSLDTIQNAAMSAAILKEEGVRRIVLVTQAFHMPRAVRLFRAAGLEVIPAPTHFKAGGLAPVTVTDFLPRASALHNSFYAQHEWLGIAWLALTVE